MPTANRPVPLPNRGNAAPVPAVGVGSAGRLDGGQVVAVPGDGMLPAGAERFSKSFYDAKGAHRTTRHGVPVNRNGEVVATAYECRRCGSAAWFPPVMKQPPLCPADGRVMRLRPDRSWLGDAWAQVPWGPMARSVNRPLWAVWGGAGVAGVGALAEAGHASGALLAVAAVPAGLVAYPVARRRLLAKARKRRRAELVRNGMSRKDAAQAVTWELLDEHLGRRGLDTLARHARTAGYCAAAACGWTALAATTGLDPHSAAADLSWTALAAVWAYPAATWWRWLRGQRRQTPAPPPSVPVVAQAVEGPKDIAARTWDEEVAYPGTRLDVDTWERIACGWQAVVVATKRGALSNLGGDALKGTVKRVAGAYDVPKSAITWIEEYEDSPNKALLLVQPNNPLKQAQVWPGPDSIRIEKSRIVARVGTFIDGKPMDEVLFRFGQGAPGGVTIGTTGAGKSEKLRLRLIIERYTSFVDPTSGQRKGLFLSFLHDPKRLESFAEFRNAVHGYGITRDDAHLMVDAFLREMIRRYDYLASLKWTDSKGRDREGSVKWNPLVHGPILSVIFDEHHELAGDTELVKKEENLARYIRACAMRCEVASHMATLGDTGSQALRDMVAGGRATLLRTTSGLNGSLVTGGQLVGDPRGLPRDPGMALVSDGESATVMGRHCFIPGDEADSDVTLYDWLFDDNNNPVGFPAEIPPETAAAFGPGFMQWMAAGRQRGGRGNAPWASAGPAPSAPVDGQRALDALLLILVEADGPLSRPQIIEAPVWAGRAVSTLSAALRAGQSARPPLLRKVPDTATYEPTEAGRDVVARASARSDEEQLVLATEAGEAT